MRFGRVGLWRKIPWKKERVLVWLLGTLQVSERPKWREVWNLNFAQMQLGRKVVQCCKLAVGVVIEKSLSRKCYAAAVIATAAAVVVAAAVFAFTTKLPHLNRS